MATTSTPAGDGTFDFGGAFRFFFEDPEWLKKAVIGGALTLGGAILLPVLLSGLVLTAMTTGYAMRVLQRSWVGDPRPLPEWTDYGTLMKEGFRFIGLYLAHVVIVMFVPAMLILVLIVAGGALSHNGSEAAGGLIALGVFALYALIGILGLLLSVYLPAALTRMTLYQRFGAGFEYKENVAFIKRNPKNYLLAWLTMLLVQAAAQVGVVACCVGIFVTAFWAQCVMAWSFGWVARHDTFLGQQVTAPAPGA
jgi:hypothetical protein